MYACERQGVYQNMKVKRQYVYFYHLTPYELGAANVLLHRKFERYICDGRFDALLLEDAWAIFLDPDSLSEAEMGRLTERYKEDKGTIIAFTKEPKTAPAFGYVVVDLRVADHERRWRVFRVLQDIALSDLDSGGELPAPEAEEWIALHLKTTGWREDKDEITEIRACHSSGKKFTVTVGGENGLSLPLALKLFSGFYPEAAIVGTSPVWRNFLLAATEKTGACFDKDRLFLSIDHLAAKMFPAEYVRPGAKYDLKTAYRILFGEKEEGRQMDEHAALEIYQELVKRLCTQYGIKKLGEAKRFFTWKTRYLAEVQRKMEQCDEKERSRIRRDWVRNSSEYPRPYEEKP